MSYIVNAQVIGNQQALELIGALTDAGIPRDSVRVIDPAAEPEHRDDHVSSRALRWGLLGGTIGAAFGGVVMSWWSLPWIGAAWGAVAGAICFGRLGGEAVAKNLPREPLIPSTQIAIATADHTQTEQVRQICTAHRAWAIRIAGVA